MKMPNDWLGESTQLQFIDRYRERTAPIVLWGCVNALAGGQEPEVTLVESTDAGKETTWCILWLTADRIIYVRATNNVADWDAYDSGEAAGATANLEAWAAPRSSVVRIELDTATVKKVRSYSERETDWHWEATYRVVLEGGKTITLPLLGDLRSTDHEAEVTRVVRSIPLSA